MMPPTHPPSSYPGTLPYPLALSVDTWCKLPTQVIHSQIIVLQQIALS